MTKIIASYEHLRCTSRCFTQMPETAGVGRNRKCMQAHLPITLLKVLIGKSVMMAAFKTTWLCEGVSTLLQLLDSFYDARYSCLGALHASGITSAALCFTGKSVSMPLFFVGAVQILSCRPELSLAVCSLRVRCVGFEHYSSTWRAREQRHPQMILPTCSRCKHPH